MMEKIEKPEITKMEEYDNESGHISKSQRKRDMLALQSLGERLVQLSSEQIHQLDLPTELRDAVFEAQSIRQRGALRRQLQYIGRLMRSIDAQTVQAKLDQQTSHSAAETAFFHRVEHWREQLLHDEQTAMTAFFREYPHADRQQLRQLVGSTKKELSQNKSSGQFRKLFQFLRATMSANKLE